MKFTWMVEIQSIAGFPQPVEKSTLRTGLKSLADWLGVGTAEKSEDPKATVTQTPLVVMGNIEI